MKLICTLALALFLSACQTLEYKGADAGTVIMGIGTVKPGYTGYYFRFRKIGEEHEGVLSYNTGVLLGLDGDKSDYENSSEKGIVKSWKLAPGNYELYNFTISQSMGSVGSNSYSSRKDFSIPFTVFPNTATYIGNYQANPILEKNLLGIDMGAGAVFVVSDREQTDIGLLKKRQADELFQSVVNATPTTQSINSPLFVDANSKL